MLIHNCQNIDSKWHKNANKVSNQSFFIYSYTNMSITPKQNEIFTKFYTHMYGHTLRTHKTFGGILPLGGAIIVQNMKLPFDYNGVLWYKILYFTNALVYHYKTLYYPKMIWLQRHLSVKTDQSFNRITRGCIYDLSAISIDIILIYFSTHCCIWSDAPCYA